MTAEVLLGIIVVLILVIIAGAILFHRAMLREGRAIQLAEQAFDFHGTLDRVLDMESVLKVIVDHPNLEYYHESIAVDGQMQHLHVIGVNHWTREEADMCGCTVTALDTKGAVEAFLEMFGDFAAEAMEKSRTAVYDKGMDSPSEKSDRAEKGFREYLQGSDSDQQERDTFGLMLKNSIPEEERSNYYAKKYDVAPNDCDHPDSEKLFMGMERPFLCGKCGVNLKMPEIVAVNEEKEPSEAMNLVLDTQEAIADSIQFKKREFYKGAIKEETQAFSQDIEETTKILTSLDSEETDDNVAEFPVQMSDIFGTHPAEPPEQDERTLDVSRNVSPGITLTGVKKPEEEPTQKPPSITQMVNVESEGGKIVMKTPEEEPEQEIDPAQQQMEDAVTAAQEGQAPVDEQGEILEKKIISEAAYVTYKKWGEGGGFAEFGKAYERTKALGKNKLEMTQSFAPSAEELKLFEWMH